MAHAIAFTLAGGERAVHASLVVLLVGLIYILGFGGLSFLRRQGLSLRFAIEGLLVTGICVLLTYVLVPINPLLFFLLIYLVTMRVRLLVDIGNWLGGRGEHSRALAVYALALRLGPDAISRQIVFINRGSSLLLMRDAPAAYATLQEALADERVQPGAKYLAAGYYNLGLACRRTGREAEAIKRFNEAIQALPASIYAYAAQRALQEGHTGKPAGPSP